MKEQNLNTEQKILEVAEKLFLDQGYAMTSTTQIAKAVGCNQALVHYYFRTKENLFSRIFKDRFHSFFTDAFTIDEENISFEEKISSIISKHFDMLKAYPEMPKLIVKEMNSASQIGTQIKSEIKDLPEKIFKSLQTQLNEEIASGKMNAVSLFDVLFTALSLNISTFLITPIAFNVIGMDESFRNDFYARRKEENVKVVLRYLKK